MTTNIFSYTYDDIQNDIILIQCAKVVFLCLQTLKDINYFIRKIR